MAFSSTSGVRVVLVDDSACFRNAARELLEQRGYTVVGEAASGASALQAVTDLRPDALLLDVELPDANGAVLADELVQVWPELAVLLVSARPLEAGLCRGTQACGFLVKSELGRVDLTEFWPSPNSSGVAEAPPG